MIQSKDFLNTLGEISPESPFSPFSPNSPTLWALSGQDDIFSQLKDFVATFAKFAPFAKNANILRPFCAAIYSLKCNVNNLGKIS